MADGLKIDLTWWDDDLFVLYVNVSNGCFSGGTDVYLGLESLRALAEQLKGFPLSTSDQRAIEFGNLNPPGAGGGLRMRFLCTDRAGHCSVNVDLRAGREADLQAVTLTLPVTPAGIDEFVRQLQTFKAEPGTIAELPMDS